MTVLDASAVLALVHHEPGADVVAAAIASATLATANLAEVIGRLVDADIDGPTTSVTRPGRPSITGWRSVGG